jgi:hypothetical protein
MLHSAIEHENSCDHVMFATMDMTIHNNINYIQKFKKLAMYSEWDDFAKVGYYKT